MANYIKIKKRKSILLIMVIINLVVLIKLIWTFSWGYAVPTNSLYIEQVICDDYYLNVKGNTSNSALAYSGCSYHWEGSVLFLKPRFVLTNIIHSSGKFEISGGGPFEGVTDVYIQGKDKADMKLLWSR